MISEEEESFAWRLHQYREKIGLKQEEAAKVLRLDATAITKIEHGERSVSAMDLVALAKAYHVPASMLLDEDQPIREAPNIGMKHLYLVRTLDPVGDFAHKVSSLHIMSNGSRMTRKL